MILGRGTYKTVYKGALLGQPVAVALMSTGAPVGSAEVEANLRLCHPALVFCYGFTENVQHIVSEMMEGGTLYDELRQGKLQVHQRLIFARQLCSGLEYLHSKDVMHRDIKSP